MKDTKANYLFKEKNVVNKDIPKDGREVQCGYCSSTWHQMPTSKPTATRAPPSATPLR